MLFGGSKGKTSYGVVMHTFLACVLTGSLFVERCFRLLIYLQALPTFSVHVTPHTLLQLTYGFTQPLTVHIILHIFTYTSHVTSHIHMHFIYCLTYPTALHLLLHIPT